MAKVTSKLQVTVPKVIADHYRIRPGDEIQWLIAGDTIRVVPHGRAPQRDVNASLRRFDQATARQQERNATFSGAKAPDRGWTREDLYDRGRPR
jgi:bifunctional DNA-binding transcriptional regulator/antitoxin component of YhaV-PrlF toxin-antitoxin module